MANSNVLGNLTRAANSSPGAGIVEKYISRAAERSLGRRREMLSQLASAQDVAAWQSRVRDICRGWLGPRPVMPESVPAWRALGHIEREGYRVEVLTWQSLPGVITTANLYLPRGRSGPFPAVLCFCNAWPEGKANADYQRFGQVLARRGIAALIFDSVGQGERLEYYDATLRRSWLGKSPADERAHLGHLLFLTGHHLSQWMLTDALRGLDLLCARSEIDASRLGLAGDDSGGALAALAAAVDSRPAALAIAGEVCTPDALGGEDIERCYFGAFPNHFASSDLLLAALPRPVLLAAYGPERGSRQHLEATAAELQRVLGLLGSKEAVPVVETDGARGLPRDLRARFLDHFAKTFRLPDERVREPETPPESAESLACTETGQVSNSINSTSYFSYHCRLASGMPPQVAVPRDAEGVRALQDELRGRIMPFLHLPKTDFALKGEIESRSTDWGLFVEKGRVVIDDGLYIPYSFYAPPESAGARRPAPTVLALHERGIPGISQLGPWLQSLAAAGVHVAAIDVAGIGETRLQHDRDDADAYDKMLCGAESVWARRALNAGLSLFGLRVFSVLRTLTYLRTRWDVDPANLCIAGVGRGGLWGLYAAALDQEVARVAVIRGLSTYQSLVERRRQNHHFSLCLPGALKVFDLPHVAACVAPRPLTLINPVDQRKERRDSTAAGRDYALTSALYRLLRTSSAFSIVNADSAPETLAAIQTAVGVGKGE